VVDEQKENKKEQGLTTADGAANSNPKADNNDEFLSGEDKISDCKSRLGKLYQFHKRRDRGFANNLWDNFENHTSEYSLLRDDVWLYNNPYSTEEEEAPDSEQTRWIRSQFLVMLFSVVMVIISVLDLYLPQVSLGIQRQVLNEEGRLDLLLISLFTHGNLFHLSVNVVAFSFLGLILSHNYGFLAFPTVPILSGLIAAAASLQFYTDRVYLLGSSGIVYSMLGLLCTTWSLARFKTRWMIFIIPAVLLALQLWQSEIRVSHLSHVFGFLLGCLFGLLLKNQLLGKRNSI
jgi:membrane associated rhomboid family serine protease